MFLQENTVVTLTSLIVDYDEWIDLNQSSVRTQLALFKPENSHLNPLRSAARRILLRA
jgi:hypothetical protein